MVTIVKQTQNNDFQISRVWAALIVTFLTSTALGMVHSDSVDIVVYGRNIQLPIPVGYDLVVPGMRSVADRLREPGGDSTVRYAAFVTEVEGRAASLGQRVTLSNWVLVDGPEAQGKVPVTTSIFLRLREKLRIDASNSIEIPNGETTGVASFVDHNPRHFQVCAVVEQSGSHVNSGSAEFALKRNACVSYLHVRARLLVVSTHQSTGVMATASIAAADFGNSIVTSNPSNVLVAATEANPLPQWITDRLGSGIAYITVVAIFLSVMYVIAFALRKLRRGLLRTSTNKRPEIWTRTK